MRVVIVTIGFFFRNYLLPKRHFQYEERETIKGNHQVCVCEMMKHEIPFRLCSV